MSVQQYVVLKAVTQVINTFLEILIETRSTCFLDYVWNNFHTYEKKKKGVQLVKKIKSCE